MREIYRGLFAPVALIGLIHIIGGTAVLFARKRLTRASSKTPTSRAAIAISRRR
jgi:hypothetical protein